MKRKIAIVISLMLAICLALAGCAQDTVKQEADLPGGDLDTGDASIMDGTNDPVGEAIGHEAIAVTNGEAIPDGAAEEAARSELDPSGGNMTSDGMYQWQVGNYTLTTKIDVMDYIDGENWDVKAMSEALGYYPVEGYGIVSITHYRNDGTPIVDLEFNSADNYYGRFYIKTFNDPSSETIMWLTVICDHTQNEYDLGSKGTVKIPFELIVAYTYACEHLADDPSVDPFYEMMPPEATGYDAGYYHLDRP